MITDAFTNASIVARISVFMGLVPLGMGIAYAVWPTEQRLALMRPVSLASIFASVSGTACGANLFRLLVMYSSTITAS